MTFKFKKRPKRAHKTYQLRKLLCLLHILSAYSFRRKSDFCGAPREIPTNCGKKSGFLKKVAKNLNSLAFIWPHNWSFGRISGPSDAEFQVQLEGNIKYIHQKCPKVRVSNGKTALADAKMLFHRKLCLIQIFFLQHELRLNFNISLECCLFP